MSYLNKVALWRERNRETEERRKKAKEAARKAGIAGRGLSAERRYAEQPEGAWRWLRNALDAMDPRTWKSKKTLAHEAAVAKKKAEQEAADQAKAAAK
jgi:hypothetical protein